MYLSFIVNIYVANNTNSAALVRRGFAPPPHAAPLSKAQFSLNIHLFILIIDLESISKKILKYASWRGNPQTFE